MTIRSVLARGGVAIALLAVFEAGPLRSQEPGGAAKAQELALKTAETIEFTTDEVTWMSVDVSPDGRTIVFDLLGDLYTLPIDGGDRDANHRRPVVREPADVFSPDGKHDRVPERSHRRREPVDRRTPTASNPRAVSKDGLDATIGRRSWCRRAWTPDGQYLVVSKSRPPDPGTFWLFMYHRDGGNGIRVGAAPPPQPAPDAHGPPPPPAPNRMGAVVSPDGRFIYYAAAHRHLHLQRALPAVADLPPRPRDRRRRRRSPTRRGARCGPLLSPDGKLLVYGTRHKTETGLRVRNLETGDERWLALPGDARRPGIARQPRHAARLRVPARRQVADRADRRQAAPRRLRHRRDRA